MGLDMYLSKVKKEMVGYLDLNIDEIRKDKPNVYAKIRPYIIKQGKPNVYEWETLVEDVGYWRKANQIHNWFVENVQNNIDDCNRYEVTKEQLEELLKICKEVLASCKLVEGKVVYSYSFNENNEKIPNYEDGFIIEDSTTAEALLPTCAGFFFGGTEYDEFYLKNIEDTIKILEKVLKETDFDEYTIFYQSSW